tara:strand:+ start:404 stop:958 length:555 start_codon:yes stop_codon:yes gene_type:complete
MTGQINVNKIAARTGNTITVNSGDKISGDAGSIVAPGHVIQVQHASFSSQISTTSSTIAATGIQMNFTPHRATSKLLVRFNIQGVYNNTANSGWNFYVYRDGSGVTESGLDTASGQEGRFVYAFAHSTGGEIMECTSEVFLSANNTNQTLIALYGRIYNSGTSYINVNSSNGDRSFMTVEEVAQ